MGNFKIVVTAGDKTETIMCHDFLFILEPTEKEETEKETHHMRIKCTSDTKSGALELAMHPFVRMIEQDFEELENTSFEKACALLKKAMGLCDKCGSHDDCDDEKTNAEEAVAKLMALKDLIGMSTMPKKEKHIEILDKFKDLLSSIQETGPMDLKPESTT